MATIFSTSTFSSPSFSDGIHLDLVLTIMNEYREPLYKISGKIHKNILNLQIIKLFVHEIFKKALELIQSKLVIIELIDGKYEQYIFSTSHLLLQPPPSSSTPSPSSLLLTPPHYENDENKIILTVYDENGLQSFLDNSNNLKDFLFVIGSDEDSMYLYDNWCLHDTTSIADVIHILEDRTAEYYLSNNRSGNSFQLSRYERFSRTSVRDDEEDSKSPEQPSPLALKLQRDELKEICESISFLLVPKTSLPKLLFRLSLRTFRSSDSPAGKTYTIHNLVVRQDDREWSIQYRYSDFARLHEQLSSQEDSSPGYLPKQSLPHLPSKKLITTRSSTSSLYIDRRRVKLGKYINALISLPGALDNQLICDFLELRRYHEISPEESINPTTQRHLRNTMHVSKLNTEARWGDIVLFKCNPETHSHLSSSANHNWEWDHIGLVVLSQSEFSGDRSNNIIDDSIVSLDVLELTSEGVTLYPLTGRIRAYNYNKYVRYMGIRKLRGYSPTPEMASKLDDFITSVLGKTPAKILGKGKKPATTPSPKFSIFPTFSDDFDGDASMHETSSPASTSGADISNYTNAELVAAALKILGIIPKHYNPDYFWTGAFAQNDEIDTLTNEQVFNYGEELILDCKAVEVNRAVERYSIRKVFDQQVNLDSLPESKPQLSHINSSQVPNLGLLDINRSFSDEPDKPPQLQHFSSYGIPNAALFNKGIPHIPEATMIALEEESDDEGNEDEARKAAVRGMPKSQSLKELRLNSKHVVSEGFVESKPKGVDEDMAQKANEMLMNAADDD